MVLQEISYNITWDSVYPMNLPPCRFYPCPFWLKVEIGCVMSWAWGTLDVSLQKRDLDGRNAPLLVFFNLIEHGTTLTACKDSELRAQCFIFPSSS